MKNIIYLLGLLVLFSCKKENSIFKDSVLTISKDIFLTEKQICTDSFFKNINLIHLETTPQVLIKFIFDIYLYDNTLFIFHDYQISCFDLNGKFLRRIGEKGNGPGEYQLLPENATFQDNNIYLNNKTNGEILAYTIQGKFISSFNTHHNISQIKILNNDFIIGYAPNNLGKEINRLYLYNKTGTIIDSLKNDIIYNDFNSYVQYDNERPMFYSKNKSIMFKETLSDTIFTINSNFSPTPYLILNMGNLAPKPDDIFKMNDLFLKNKIALEIVYANNNYIIFHEKKAPFTCVVWNKENSKIEQIKFIYNKDLANLFNKEKSYIELEPGDESSKIMTKDGTPYFLPKFVSEDNNYLIGYETSAINEDDNPIIILAEMK